MTHREIREKYGLNCPIVFGYIAPFSGLEFFTIMYFGEDGIAYSAEDRLNLDAQVHGQDFLNTKLSEELILLDWFVPQNMVCICDMWTVLMISGCKCGGK